MGARRGGGEQMAGSIAGGRAVEASDRISIFLQNVEGQKSSLVVKYKIF
jgi:hypothetical protein